jgi:MerR family transcriptional regulator, mercuric resistance operon regulatory protein
VPSEFSIGTLAAMSGVKIETIRYYERIGVMSKPPRSAAGYRRYTGEHLKRLIFIRRGRELAFSLDVLSGLLRLVDGHAHTCAEGRTLAIEHLGDIRGKIADLRRLERAMADIAARCTGKPVPDCALVDALFSAPAVSARIQAGRRSHGTPRARMSRDSDCSTDNSGG